MKQNKKQNKTKAEPKIKFLNPSDKIMNRIRWDSVFDVKKLSIGYLDRFVGLQWTNIEGFDIGDIPYHRIVLLKYEDVLVWDRVGKLDLITGRGIEDVGNLDFVPPKEEEEEIIKEKRKKEKTQLEEKNEEIIQENEVSVQNEEESKIIFSKDSKKDNYIPEDYLELWMIENNNRDFALENPTHISQKGGFYHIDNSNMEEFFNSWSIACQDDDTPFYIKEVVDKKFKLNIDVDIFLQKKEKYDIVSNGWIQEILNFVLKYFKGSNEICLVTESHGDYKEAYSPATIYKSGYHLYFPFIYVDKITFVNFTTDLSLILDSKFKIENLSNDVTFKDVIDSCIGTRIFGSSKLHQNQNQNLGRKHSFIGVFTSKGVNENLYEKLKENLFEFVQLTQSNILTKSENHEKKRILKSKLFTKDGVSDIDSHLLLPDYLEEFDSINY
eukprot:gene7938-12407_t